MVLSGAPLDGTISFDDLLAGRADTIEAPGNAPGDLSTICYTSGTTGFPKGAMLSHHSVVLNAAMTAAMNMRTEHDVQFTGLPLAHVYGTVVMNLSFLLGLTFVMLEKFDTQQALEAIQRHKVTIMDGVPTMYLYMLSYPDFAKYDLSSLRTAVVGGQAMPPAKATEWQERVGTPILELWGMTELAGPGIMQHSYCDNRLGSVGILMPFMQGRIADPADPSKTLPEGEVGELMVKGPYTMLGYYGNEKATTETIEPDGWLHSGDLCKMDADGYFYIVDRKKDMILTAGYNIYPAEIERVIVGHPSVAMVGVGARPDPHKGEIAKAYIVLKSGASADADDIIELLPQASGGLQGAARGAIRPGAADDVVGQDHAARAEDARSGRPGRPVRRRIGHRKRRPAPALVQAPASGAVAACFRAASARSASPSRPAPRHRPASFPSGCRGSAPAPTAGCAPPAARWARTAASHMICANRSRCAWLPPIDTISWRTGHNRSLALS